MEDQPIEFEQFLKPYKFQELFLMVLFKFERRNERLWSKRVLGFLHTFFYHFEFFFFSFYDIVRSAQRHEPSNQNFAVFSIAFYCSVRGMMMMHKHKAVIDLLNEVEQCFPPDLVSQRILRVQQVYDYHEKRYRFVKTFANLGLPLYCVTPAIVYIMTYKDSSAPITLDQQLLGGWLPFDLRQSHTAYPFVWIFDSISAVSAISFFVAFDTVFNVMLAQLIMHLEALQRELSAIDISVCLQNPNSEHLFYQKIKQLVFRQQHINKLASKFNDLFKLVIFLNDLVAAASLCFNLYLITESSDLLLMIKYSLPTLMLLVFTFDLCMRGALLEEASSKVQEALYNQNWYMGDKKYRKLHLMWLQYSQQTCKVTAYELTDVNMAHFTDIIQLAYRLFAFLKSRG